MYLWRSASVRRSLWHQAPPWHSTRAGNGPWPRGLYTRANSGLSPWRRYSTSSTSKSVVFASRVAVVMGVSFLAVCRIVAHGGLVGKHGRRGCAALHWLHAGPRQHRPVPLRARCRRRDGVRELSHRRRRDRVASHRDAAASARARSGVAAYRRGSAHPPRARPQGDTALRLRARLYRPTSGISRSLGVEPKRSLTVSSSAACPWPPSRSAP